MREIADKAGVGLGTLYRHFPQRADLIAAIFRREIDACADAAPRLAAEHGPSDALACWMQRYAASSRPNADLQPPCIRETPAFDTLPAYFQARLVPALRTLLDAAAAAGEVRGDRRAGRTCWERSRVFACRPEKTGPAMQSA